MSAPRDSPSRFRHLNPLMTSLANFSSPSNTPQSAVSIQSAYPYSAAPTPSSSHHRYNPQEWGASPAVGPERMHTFPLPANTQDAQGSPLPPPPYSPPRSQGQMSNQMNSAVLNTPPPPSSAGQVTSPTSTPTPTSYRPSPEPVAPQNFPPPPGAGGRGASRERRFGLPSLGRRRDRDAADTITPPSPHPPASISRPPPQPLHIHAPTPVDRSLGDLSANPPSSRRAASTSAIDASFTPRSRSASQSRWEPGMPLPPPPPGPPPPSGSRSQSLNRTTTEPILSPPTRRPAPEGVTALGPVPPTPADWNQHSEQTHESPATTPANDSSTDDSSNTNEPESTSGSSTASSGALNRNGAVRGEKTLRERRAESRTRQVQPDSSGDAQPLSDIVVPQGAGISRRFSVRRGTPRSGSRLALELEDNNPESANSTPRQSAGLRPEAATPPFSPLNSRAQSAADQSSQGQTTAPKSLPTPPPQSRSASRCSQSRPEGSNMTSAPLSASILTSKQAAITQPADQFCRGSIERFHNFAHRESAAKTDAERVKLFADFIVNESRLRRERYNGAIGAMGSEILDLTRDLFRPMQARRDSSSSQMSEWTPQSSDMRSNRNSFSSAAHDQPQPNSAPASGSVSSSPAPSPGNGPWSSNQFRPSLSPILSMSVSERNDESSSRGRPASRWWEEGSNGEGGRLERSKRESKYMGVSRESLQWQAFEQDEQGQAGPSKPQAPDEYPPEKTGWLDADQPTPQPQRDSVPIIATPTPTTPSKTLLDVSRLVTLPPPYPRHHPAVNNNHPELTSIHTQVRTLSDMAEVQTIKDTFTEESQKKRDDAKAQASERRQATLANLQREIAAGNMSYADAAAIEADGKETEKKETRDVAKREYERFQSVVIEPVNDLLTKRIEQATQLFEELRSRLFIEHQATNPNTAQEEGDEQPELLEKLTLLKWIFEARENLYRAIYDLLSERNDKFQTVVLTPYRQAGNEEKARNAEAFFAEDLSKRRMSYTNEVLNRTREFRNVVDENVTRGVDVQLNAFWDIAPLLRECVLDKIPPAPIDGRRFQCQIPASEYAENPSYHDHPLQYLYSLLLHAEKSTYQFIESQTNLRCLAHEVKEAVMGARAKVNEAEGRMAPNEVESMTTQERNYLTEDLKEKVKLVQEQWEDALGMDMRSVKERIGEWLLSTGGWDESLEDNGVGGG